jgi:hypothetical protein
MTPNNHDDISGDLGRALHDRADGVGAPLTLADVKGRATRIRRRRAIAASAAAAAAVAIIVPTAIAGSNMFDSSESGGQVATNPTPDPTDTGPGARSWPQPLDTSDLELGERASAGSLTSQARVSSSSSGLIPAHARTSTPIDSRCATARSSVLSALHGASRTRAPAFTNGVMMQIVSARMCWRHAMVRPLKSEAATVAPNEVVIGVVHAIHSSSAASMLK